MTKTIAFGAFYQWFLEERDEKPSEETLGSARKFWDQLYDSLNERPFRNGQHYGDCVKVPCSCTRCFLENFEKIGKLVYLDKNNIY
jgi:hypothetical protein